MKIISNLGLVSKEVHGQMKRDFQREDNSENSHISHAVMEGSALLHLLDEAGEKTKDYLREEARKILNTKSGKSLFSSAVAGVDEMLGGIMNQLDKKLGTFTDGSELAEVQRCMIKALNDTGSFTKKCEDALVQPFFTLLNITMKIAVIKNPKLTQNRA